MGPVLREALSLEHGEELAKDLTSLPYLHSRRHSIKIELPGFVVGIAAAELVVLLRFETLTATFQVWNEA